MRTYPFLNIAGIPLKLDSEDRVLPESFEKFIEINKKLNGCVWHIESKKLASLKRRSNQLSFYFDDLVFFDIKKRKIICSNSNIFDSRFITYIYSQILALNKGLLLHAACIIRDRKSYLFLGASGEGKSTIAKLSRRHKVLGDDVIAVRKIATNYHAFSTPWQQSHLENLNNNTSTEIKAIFFIKKSKRISFKPVRQEEALVRILSRHTHFLQYTKMPMIKKLFSTAFDFVKSIPSYEMEFRKDKDFWPELERAIT
jgi:hypothetical protein